MNLLKHLGFVLNDDASLIEPTIIETEKVLSGLIQLLRLIEMLQPSVFSLRT